MFLVRNYACNNFLSFDLNQLRQIVWKYFHLISFVLFIYFWDMFDMSGEEEEIVCAPGGAQGGAEASVPMAQFEINSLKHSRAYVRSSVTRNINKLNMEVSTLIPSDCDKYIDVFTELGNTLDELNGKIANALSHYESDGVALIDEREKVTNYDNQIQTAINLIQIRKRVLIDGVKSKISLSKRPVSVPHSTAPVNTAPFAKTSILTPRSLISVTSPIRLMPPQSSPIYTLPPTFNYRPKFPNPPFTYPPMSTIASSSPLRQPPIFTQSTIYQPTHTPPNDTSPINPNYQMNTHMKLPQVPLPEYGKLEGESLEYFIANFENIINRYPLSEFEKFVLLSRQLSNEPLILIKSLQGSQQSYTEAKELLIKAFSSPLNQKFDILERLCKLKLKKGANPYSFISEMRIITHSFSTLQMDTETILQYFFWHAMHDQLRNQFVNITNCNKPSLSQINEYIFQAVERYQSVNKGSCLPETVQGYAANVNYKSSANSATEPNFQQKANKKSKACILCATEGDTFHPIFKCAKYSTPRMKVDRLKQLNACIKCAYATHKTSECKFKFHKECSNCSGKHFSFLCMAKSNRNNELIQSHTATVSFNMSTSNVGKTSILPTFTNTLNNSEIRILRDTGAQTCFICRDVAERENLEVVGRINLTLNGFNVPLNYDTNIVEINMKFGSKLHKIRAVCVPYIPIKLNLPGLARVAKAVTDRGFILADKQLQLSDNIGNIEMVLGSDALYCLPETNIIFGQNGLLSETPLGLLLYGKVINLSDNLEYYRIDTKSPITYDTHNDNTSECISINSVGVNFNITDEEGNLMLPELQRATDSLILNSNDDILNEKCINFLNHDDSNQEVLGYQKDDDLVQETLDGITRAPDGRLIMPLMWDRSLFSMLPHNYHLSTQILKSNIKKLARNKDRLIMVDNVFKEQLDLGIISKIDNVQQFMSDNPACSFLGHMPIFKLTN